MLGPWRDFPTRGTEIKLTPTADLVSRIGDHLVPLRNPASGTCQRCFALRIKIVTVAFPEMLKN